MKNNWSKEELAEFWSISPEERGLINLKQGAQKFFFVLVLKCYSHERRFLDNCANIPESLLKYGCAQFGIIVAMAELEVLLSNIRNYNRYKCEIREFLGIKLFSAIKKEELSQYLDKLVLETNNVEKLQAEAKLYLLKHKVELPAEEEIDKLVKSVINKLEKYLFEYINSRMTSTHTERIEDILLGPADVTGEVGLSFLKQDSGKSDRDSIIVEINKLQMIKTLCIHTSLIPENISTKVLKFYKRKILGDTPEQIRRKPNNIKYPLVIIFCYLKQQELIDNLADHLVTFIHKIKKKADKTEFAINSEIGRLSKGLNSLYLVAEIARDKPCDVIQDVIYPIVPRDQIDALVKARYLAANLRSAVRNKTIQSYSIYYRKMIFEILNNIEIKTNNISLLTALAIVIKHQNSRKDFYPVDVSATTPTTGLVHKNDMAFILSNEPYKGNGDANHMISRKDYEYAIFKYLRDSLKTKETWLEGSFKYRNPEYDIPQDFEDNKEYYYGALGQPLSSEEFIDTVRGKLSDAINNLDNNIQHNQYVKITTRNSRPWIRLSPVPEQPKPQNLETLKKNITSKWGIINLLDILKEVDLRERFTECFISSGNREILSPKEIQKRLILCLFAIGTNTGLTRISSAYTNKNVSLEELKHIKRKFINQDDMREAITKVVNGIFRIRSTDIWGEATTACSSDSKKFTSWDQNLSTEWHARYKGAGVMIYWHVTTQSICVYSQLKTCSSSEVASMLQGVLSQETDTSIESQYVDSHGKSECGFALTYLLSFDLLPRYKEIGSQKIYLPDEGLKCKNISDITTRPIKWELIATHYNEIIKFAAALKVGTATADSIIRQFSRSNYQHPVFKAFIELGKAVKSIFLCRYLGSLELRQEIHSALNIVENWNSVNRFIFYGKNGEISTNSRDEQEYSMLGLHLLQVCLAYINTLLIQDILSSEIWRNRLTTEDLRALTPLIYQHINPYGTFELDMNRRLPLEVGVA